MADEKVPARGIDPSDFEGIGITFSGEERLVRDTVRAFVEKRVLPEIGAWYEAGRFPRELIGELASIGLFGMDLEGYGCAGLGPVAYGLACFELEAGDSGFRSFVSVQGSLSMFAIHRYGSPDQKAQFLPKMAKGEAIGCFGLTEPDAGSDLSAMRTFARRDGSDWVLSGTKLWITNGSLADVAIVWAQSDEGMRGFLVERDTPGFSSRDLEHKASLRASVTSELVLDDCRLPESARLPLATGVGAPLSCLSEARYGIVWGAMGAANACFRAALCYAKERSAFGKPLAGFQLTQQKLADMALELEKGMLLAHHLGTLKAHGRLSPEHVSIGKLNNTREALAIARTARTILGANGISFEYPLMRHAANLESVLTYEGTAEVHQLVIGRALTGLDAFS